MPKALIAIPHYFRGDSAGAAGHDSSQGASRQARARALGGVIVKLHECFGPNRLIAVHDEARGIDHPNPFGLQLDLVLVTMAGEDHLIDDLPCDPALFRRVIAEGRDPRLLGFGVHQLIGAAAGSYDWYGYLEDDIVIEDPHFFVKLAYFNRLLRAWGLGGALVQPNRFETATDCPTPRPHIAARKLYPDQRMRSAPLFEGASVVFEALGHACRLEPAHHPHSGCFFLDAQQVGKFVSSPFFNNQDARWMTWLDTAATLAVWKAFDIYKLSIDSPLTFEVRHSRPVMLNQLHPSARGGLTWLGDQADAELAGEKTSP